MSTTAAPTEPLPGLPGGPDVTAPVDEQQSQLYRYSSWVHVGPGAENCEDVNEIEGSNDCGNPLHFHAWCRLPNQFQHREIRELAFAAKARRARQMRNDGTDAFEILESEMDELLAGGEATKAQLIEELVGSDWWQDYLLGAQNAIEVERQEGEETVKPFEHVAKDKERHAELEAMPEDQRGDEYLELESHLTEYAHEVDRQVAEIVDPKKAALATNDLPALVDMVRKQRIDAEASEEFMNTYAMHSWLMGARRTKAGQPTFKSMAELHDAPPEVIAALKECFEDLERTERGVATGNS